MITHHFTHKLSFTIKFDDLLMMRNNKNRVLKYVFRSWKDEKIQPHPRLRIIEKRKSPRKEGL